MNYTSLQIANLEKYILESDEIISGIFSDVNKSFDSAKTLYSKIENIGIKMSLPYSWTNISFALDYGDATGEIRKDLETMKEGLQAKLNEIPYYSKYKSINNDLLLGKNVIDKAEQVKFIEANKIKYEGEIDFGKEVSKYIEQANSYGYPPLNTEQVFVGFLARIEMYLDDVCNEKATKKTVTKSEPKTVVNVQQNNNQTVNQNIEITIEQCFKRLDDCESISEEEIQKIKEQINEIECLLKDKLGKKKTIKEKIGNILKIIAEKGTDVMISVLPTIVQMLSQCK